VAVREALRAALRPEVPEPIEEASFLRAERLGIWVPLVLAAINASGLLVWRLVDWRLYGPFLACNLPAHALVIALNLHARRRGRTDIHRRNAALSAVLLNWTSVTGFMINGNVIAPSLFLVFTVVFFRFAFDARLGRIAWLSAAILPTLYWLLEIACVRWPSLIVSEVLRPTREIPVYTFTILWQNTVLFLAWVLSSHLVVQLRTALFALGEERKARLTLSRQVAEEGHGRLTGAQLGGRWRLRELLGRGGMGEVYEAEPLDGSPLVAIKVLFPHMAELPRMIERFQREAEAARRLPAACTAQLLEVGATHDGTHYIVMERLAGEDLAASLRRRGPLAPAEVAALLDELAAALDAAHAQGIVHRDLKPQNVFLTSSGVRLLDFGIARLLDGQSDSTITAEGAILGSPGFLAPEQARGATSELGPHTDVFALGAIAYRALTGHHAFPSRNPAHAIYEALHHQPAPPSRVLASVPEAFDAVLAVAMAKLPRDRYTRAGELARDFRRALDGTLPDEVPARARALTPDADPSRVTATLSLRGAGVADG
jgi:serine/threonine-protein kinase